MDRDHGNDIVASVKQIAEPVRIKGVVRNSNVAKKRIEAGKDNGARGVRAHDSRYDDASGRVTERAQREVEGRRRTPGEDAMFPAESLPEHLLGLADRVTHGSASTPRPLPLR
jgi:hypothetical protein